MIHSNGIKAFDEFWMNCVLNQMYSVACTLEPSYRYAAYLNTYQYFRWEAATDPLYKYPTIDSLYYMSSLTQEEPRFALHGVFGPVEPYYFRDIDSFQSEVQEMCKKNEIFTLNVDLFYWIPESMAWQKFHWYHHSLLNGFDERTSTYYVIDDNLHGYMEHAIPEERLIKAFQHSEYRTNPDYGIAPVLKYKLRDKIETFRLTLSEVCYHADRLIGEINGFSIDGLWNTEIDDSKLNDYLTYGMIGLNIIANRHKANESLMRALNELKLVGSVTSESLLEQIRTIREGWEMIKQHFMKASLRGKLNKDECYRLLKVVLLKEVEMWQTLLKVERGAIA